MAEDKPCVFCGRLRHGRQGGSWRHVKEVLQAGGNRIVFVDGESSCSRRGNHKLSHRMTNLLIVFVADEPSCS